MRRAAAACLALLLLAGCRVETTVGVDAEADGRGRLDVVVALDRDAAARVPDLARQLRVDDLRAAGWEVAAPRTTDGGGVQLRAEKEFGDSAGLTDAVAELSGTAGPFRDFRLVRERSFLRTRTAFAGTVDLSAGLEAFSDAELRGRLGGSALGFDPAPLAGDFAFRVEARLPGADGTAVWRPRLGDTITLATRAAQWNVRTIAAALVSVLTAAAAALLTARRLRRPQR